MATRLNLTTTQQTPPTGPRHQIKRQNCGERASTTSPQSSTSGSNYCPRTAGRRRGRGAGGGPTIKQRVRCFTQRAVHCLELVRQSTNWPVLHRGPAPRRPRSRFPVSHRKKSHTQHFQPPTPPAPSPPSRHSKALCTPSCPRAPNFSTVLNNTRASLRFWKNATETRGGVARPLLSISSPPTGRG